MSSRSSRVFAHPGFTLPAAAHRSLQATTQRLRRALRPGAPVMGQTESRQALLDGLGLVESVLTLHCEAQPAPREGEQRRRIRLEPPLIGQLAQLRYVLSYALGRGTCDNEPDMNWQQYRAYAHSERVVELVTPVLRGYREARAGGAVQKVALA